MSNTGYSDPVTRREKEPTTPMGRWVRDARKTEGQTQDQFAGELGVHRQTVTSWEAGEFEPKRDAVELIMRKYPRAPPPPGSTVVRSEAGSIASGASMMRAIEHWAARVGLEGLVDDNKFYGGVVALFLDYCSRKQIDAHEK